MGSASNLAMAGSSTSFGVWALSLSACGGLLAAVSSDGRLEVRRQEAKPGGQAAAASCRLVSRGLVQLHEAPRPEAAAAGAESSARAVRVLLGEAAEAPPPPAPDGQAPTPPHLALRVVAFNPNPAHRQWVACAGPSGLLACVRVPSGGKPSGKPKGRPPKAKAPKAGTASGVWIAVDDDEVGHGMRSCPTRNEIEQTPAHAASSCALRGEMMDPQNLVAASWYTERPEYRTRALRPLARLVSVVSVRVP